MKDRFTTASLFLLAVLLLAPAAAFPQAETRVEAPSVALSGIPFTVTVHPAPQDLAPDSSLTIQVGGQAYTAKAAGGAAVFEGVTLAESGSAGISLVRQGAPVEVASVRAVPAWLSVLPPLVAILVALIFRQVIAALFLGIWMGAWITYGLSPTGLWFGLLDALQVYVVNALAGDAGHVAIIIFSLMIGGMVGIISKNGGTMGVVNKIVRWASSAQRGQLAASVLGVAVFFDDYANTLIVGPTMRPITDRLRVSREKLAYIVDSTAAPVACIALVTTWIGTEVGLIGEAIDKIPGFNESAYSVFLNSIPYSFYPILAVFFVFAVALSRRDFGPMYAAERRARVEGHLTRPDAAVSLAAAEANELMPREGKPQRALNAVIPILVLVVATLTGLYVTGEGETLREIVGSADSYKALMWASLLGVLSAVLLSLVQRILTLNEALDAWYGGLKSMLLAMIVLVLAWALSSVTEQLHTANFLVSTLSEELVPGVVPALVFILAAMTAFATGTSWGTMGILMPLVVPLAWGVLAADGLHTQAEYHHIIYSAVSAVLAGAVWGDHCSPISDTTILSSMASGCDHIDHVRTQMPYALVVGLVGLLLGTLPSGFGWYAWWVALPLTMAILALLLRYLGKRADEEPGQAEGVGRVEPTQAAVVNPGASHAG